MKETHLRKYLDAQRVHYTAAFNEIKKGRKLTHWMWYIFPQISGLGFSETSRFYALKDLQEARDFLEHPVLGDRLIRICDQLLFLDETNATHIFGSPDDVKLRSSMTLFSLVPKADHVFDAVLTKYFKGEKDPKTLALLRENKN